MQSIISYTKLKGSNANMSDDAKKLRELTIQLTNAHNKSEQFVEKPENVK